MDGAIGWGDGGGYGGRIGGGDRRGEGARGGFSMVLYLDAGTDGMVIVLVWLLVQSSIRGVFCNFDRSLRPIPATPPT